MGGGGGVYVVVVCKMLFMKLVFLLGSLVKLK